MKHHLVIAGTGRAGTSFLVQYLTACGLETRLTLHPEETLDEHANAGFEDVPDGDGVLPYVIKSPWLYEFVDRLIARDDITIDAVILPMRDIVEAASSRVTLELRSRFGHEELAEEHTRWETWGATPGGVVYSLNPIDQARILAMGFHHVVHALVKKNIPTIFLDFPRFAEDSEYLYRQLQPVIGHAVSQSEAIDIHRAISNPALIRSGRELAEDSPDSRFTTSSIRFPEHEVLDRAALYRELKNARSAARCAIEEGRSTEVRYVAAETRYIAAESAQLATQQELAALREERTRLQEELQSSRANLAQVSSVLSKAEQERDSLVSTVHALEMSLASAQAGLAEICSSTAWRMTYPLRTLVAKLRGRG